MNRTAGVLLVVGREVSVTVTIQAVDGPDGEPASWYGGLLWSPAEGVEMGGPYRLLLNDGRSGQVLLLYEVTSEGRSGAAFRGVGPLD